MATNIGKQAVVIGAGMSGLAAARVLADHFDTVTLVERDTLPANAVSRAGVPQDKHQHGLLVGGTLALNELFPGFDKDLIEAGVVTIKIASDMRMERLGYDMPQRDLGYVAFAMSRPLIESVTRRRTLQHRNITLKSGWRAVNIVASSDGAAVKAVRCETKDGLDEVLPADLVIDASGRGSLILALLRSAGAPLPDVTVIGIDRLSATSIMPIPDDAPDDWKLVMTLPDPSRGGPGGLLMPIEGNRWMLATGAQDGTPAPRDWSEILDFARKIRTPTIYNAIRKSKPLQPVVRYSYSESVWRHFERLDSMPRGVLAVGDAFCRFNPVHGQGMTVAAQEAVLLRALLQKSAQEPDPLAAVQRSFHAEAGLLIETPWVMSAVSDFLYPNARGERPKDLANTLKFGAALERLAVRDPAIHKLTTEVAHLIKPRSVYQDPEIMQRVTAEMATMAAA
jgi:2-polyprenyl-6-methoxyphenol hydroxylase-like FAD-dependent oxidoreductase